VSPTYSLTTLSIDATTEAIDCHCFRITTTNPNLLCFAACHHACWATDTTTLWPLGPVSAHLHVCWQLITAGSRLHQVLLFLAELLPPTHWQ
jgi:hypothetical protein